ncbi:MAG: GTP-binding protein [Candidatus Helarchaeota archaeon]|nr:GTP-binding protein [Candidatus Helarchaeota archaeon]
MVNLEERITELRERLRQTDPNKHTMKSICQLKAQIAKLERQRMDRIFEGIGKASAAQGFDVKKAGDSNVAIIGFPSVGKSTLLNKVTNAKSKVAAYEFTTLDAIPGLMEHKHARIMVIDLPGIIKDASKGKGLGRRILAVAKTSNLILIMLDIWNQPHFQYQIILDELYNIGVRLDRFPPLISVSHLKSGGISLASTVPLTGLTLEMARGICQEFKIVNALIVAHQDITPDDLIDHFNHNCAYIPSLVVCNKMDISTPAQEKFLEELEREGRHIIRISAETGMNLDLLKDEIYRKLDLIRIYLKPKGSKADLIEPLIVPRESDVRYVASKIHRDFVERFRYAFVQHATKEETDVSPTVEHRKWKVGLNYTLQDFDVVQINLK